MSVCYRFVNQVPFDQFLEKVRADGRLQVEPRDKPGEYFLRLGDACLDVYTGNGEDTGMTAYGLISNNVDPITDILEEIFETVILGEHDEGFFPEDEVDE